MMGAPRSGAGAGAGARAGAGAGATVLVGLVARSWLGRSAGARATLLLLLLPVGAMAEAAAAAARRGPPLLPGHSNTVQPFCYPNDGHSAWDYIGDNLCVWEHSFGGRPGHRVSPGELPPPVFSDDSSGTRLPTVQLRVGGSGEYAAEVQLAVRSDAAMDVPVTFLAAPQLQAAVVAGGAGDSLSSASAVVAVRSKVSRGVRVQVTAPAGTPPGGYALSVVLHLKNTTAQRCVTWGPWSCGRPYIFRVGPPDRANHTAAPPAAPPPPPAPMQCDRPGGCHRPRWAWDRVGDMVFAHTSNGSGVFSAAATATLAKFASFTWDGSSSCRQPLAQCKGGMEATQLAQFALLKQQNPNISTIFYHDSARAWTLPNAINVSNALDEQILRNKSTADWYLRNTSGLLAIDPYEPGWDPYDGTKGGCCEVYDHRKPEVRKAWISMAQLHFDATVQPAGTSGGQRYSLVDGVFADDGSISAEQAEADWHISSVAATSFATAHTTLMREATAAVAGKGGLLVQNGGAIRTVAGNAYMFETFTPTNTTIHAMFGLATLGKVVQAHTDYYSGLANPSTFDALAAFLIGAAPYFYFSGPFGWDSTTEDDVAQRWLPEFDKPLGAPIGPPTFDAAANTWRRRFDSASVEFIVEPACRGTIRWTDGSVSAGNGGCDSTPSLPPGGALRGRRRQRPLKNDESGSRDDESMAFPKGKGGV